MSNRHHAREPLPARQQGAALIVGLVLLVVITLVGVAAMRSTTLQEKMAGNLRDSNLSFQAAEAALRHCETILQQDYALQVSLYGPPAPNAPVVNHPPVAPFFEPYPKDDQTLIPPITTPNNGWRLGGQVLPSWLPLPTGMPALIWIWRLDNGQTSFPDGTRLDANQGGTSPQPWWAEATHDRTWWEGTSSNSQSIPANTLEGLFGQPRCIFESYIYAASDTSTEAQAFRRSVPADGVVIKNENQFRRERHYYRNTARGMGGSENAVSMLQTGVYLIYYVPS